MRLSIVTPNYNGAATIERTILSVLSQRVDAETQYIVVDDGSKDRSRDIIQKFADRLTLLTKENGGLSSAINTGFRHSTGHLVCWLDSDNLALPGAFQAAVDAFRARPDASIVYGSFLHIDEEDRPIAVRRQISFDYRIALFGYQTVSNAAIYLNRTHLERVGYADESLRTACDLDLFLRLARCGPVVLVDQIMGAYRCRADALHLTLSDREAEEIKIIRRRYGGERLSDASLFARHKWYKSRALLRMLAEGKLASRLPGLRSGYLPASLPPGTFGEAGAGTRNDDDAARPAAEPSRGVHA